MAAPERQDAFWLVWSPQGERPPKFRHDSEAMATIEAERLARLRPGHTFVVLQSVCARQVNDMRCVDLRPDPKDIPF